MENANINNKKRQTSSNLLKDDRFKALFSNPDFQVDKDSEEYALLNPVISQLAKSKAKKLQQRLAQEEEEEEIQDKPDEDEPKGKIKRSKVILLFCGKVFCIYKKILIHIFLLKIIVQMKALFMIALTTIVQTMKNRGLKKFERIIG